MRDRTREALACFSGRRPGSGDLTLPVRGACLSRRRDQQRVRQHGRGAWGAVEGERVLLIKLDVGGEHNAPLRRTREDMSALAAVEPVGIIKSAATHTQDVRKALELEADRSGAPGAEVQGDTLAARVGAVRIALRADPIEGHVLPPEDRLHQKGRAGKALAESAMTNCDAHRLRGRSVADIAA